MAKARKSGKASTEAAAPESVAEVNIPVQEIPKQETVTADAAKSETKQADKSNVNINLSIKDTNIRDAVRKSDGQPFKSVTVPLILPGTDTTTFGKIAVSQNRVKPDTKPVMEGNKAKRDADGKVVTEPKEGYSNVWLYKADSKIKVNLPTGEKDANGKNTYYNDVFTAGQIKEMHDAAKNAYKEKQSAKERAAERATSVETAAPSAPSVDDGEAFG